LYPSVNKYARYPVGHHTVRVSYYLILPVFSSFFAHLYILFTVCILSYIFFIYSLYPSVIKYARYPVGHPVIFTSNLMEISTYFGEAKAKILPPTRLYHLVLPYMSNDKLKFPLCRTCADTENQNDCSCNDEKRTKTGTWCNPEIELACSMGYEIVKIYEDIILRNQVCMTGLHVKGGSLQITLTCF